MAEFQAVMAQAARMCSSNKLCTSCLIRKNCVTSCRVFMFEHPDEFEEIIMRWTAENPPKTNGAKFREVFGYDLTEKFFTSSKVRDWYNAEYKEPEEQEEEQEELT